MVRELDLPRFAGTRHGPLRDFGKIRYPVVRIDQDLGRHAECRCIGPDRANRPSDVCRVVVRSHHVFERDTTREFRVRRAHRSCIPDSYCFPVSVA